MAFVTSIVQSLASHNRETNRLLENVDLLRGMGFILRGPIAQIPHLNGSISHVLPDRSVGYMYTTYLNVPNALAQEENSNVDGPEH